jgi:3-oxoacyl-[acyl-carrier-protein] synthase III
VIVTRNGHPGRARLVGVGAHVPERVLTNADIERMVDTSDEWITTRTGIRERRVAAPGEAASDLAAAAGRDVLARTGTAAEDLDIVIVATATADHLFPPTAALVCDRLGAVNAGSFDLMAGCTGFIYALAQACALVESGLARTVLVLGGEVLTRFVDWGDRSTCVLFGDGGGGALVVAADEETTGGFLGFELATDGSAASLLMVPGGGGRRPSGAEDYRRQEAFIQMNGREVFKFATRVMVDSVSRLLERLELSVEEIDLLVPHQANIRIIEHAVKRIGIDPGRVFNNLDRYGNTSSASIPIALTEAQDAGRLRSGALLLLVAFGAGLTWGATAVRYEPVPAALGAAPA